MQRSILVVLLLSAVLLRHHLGPISLVLSQGFLPILGENVITRFSCACTSVVTTCSSQNWPFSVLRNVEGIIGQAISRPVKMGEVYQRLMSGYNL